MAKEHIVYILGAGFSVPAGLPVMQNFLSYSRDMLLDNNGEYKKHGGIFKTIRQMHHAKGYYNTDLHNIEEILSILQMQAAVSDEKSAEAKAKEFEEYIKDVIKHYTPEINIQSHQSRSLPRPYEVLDWLVKNEYAMLSYIKFVARLLHLQWVYDGVNNTVPQVPIENIKYNIEDNPKTIYSIITLNYDMILENCISFIEDHVQPESNANSKLNLNLAKLHGSLDSELVPPTWRKHISKQNSKIDAALKSAYNFLRNATKIRILGYSMPVSDNYMRYLLESAVIESKNLKQIDIISIDKDGSLIKRYKNFICFNNMRFCNEDIANYLHPPHNDYAGGVSTLGSRKYMTPTSLENIHKRFMDTHEVT